MAQTRAYKKTMNFVYGMGAAVVIIGALFKIQHFSFGFLTNLDSFNTQYFPFKFD